MMTLVSLCRTLLLCAAFTACVEAQSFLTAISQFPELSNFTTLMYDNPGLAGALLTSNATSLTQITVLVPDNSAFDKLEAQLGAPVGSLTVEQLEPILQYLVLVGEWTTDNFIVQNGTTVPTLLNGPMYNNRSAGPALGSSGAPNDPHNGQVVFIQASNSNPTSSKRFIVRQLPQPTATVQGGLGQQINLTAIDGYWDGGVFQIVDQFLDLPLNCSQTISIWNQTTFADGLRRTGIGPAVDITQNVTCLVPTNEAFVQASPGEFGYNITDLAELILFHTIDEPLYTNFLADGQEYTSFSNQTVRISIIDGSIFVNDAKLIVTNIM
ncbi:uncharacterized protein Z519_09513 [Cladophialophora bantiana CBS 173.52]|uniref:FAS1 domain-containing protein n=1 Tax=Cladophialophora bantiana (strain ATCC 10958 / CBS 173.52 / CDC B-1940 / NIH 8579) TaxID=1442370 RepID=A0A0D2FU69_CLAB1|nr:uncharacterized protein Z519_09513 [Cladophialophora bantiana CBS 173.52]KIW90082.1 hypothetical protein Z519_09513 [Cladophialophora bantiana CBS 173.52]